MSQVKLLRNGDISAVFDRYVGADCLSLYERRFPEMREFQKHHKGREIRNINPDSVLSFNLQLLKLLTCYLK